MTIFTFVVIGFDLTGMMRKQVIVRQLRWFDYEKAVASVSWFWAISAGSTRCTTFEVRTTANFHLSCFDYWVAEAGYWNYWTPLSAWQLGSTRKMFSNMTNQFAHVTDSLCCFRALVICSTNQPIKNLSTERYSAFSLSALNILKKPLAFFARPYIAGMRRFAVLRGYKMGLGTRSFTARKWSCAITCNLCQ